MHPEILSKEQMDLLPLLSQFRKEFYLLGGTAIALQIGHRRSIDFDLFKQKPFDRKKILTYTNSEQLNLLISDVKFTFYLYPFEIPKKLKYNDSCIMPELLDLAAMKAYALGKGSKWKDYVDLFFLLKGHFTIKEISDRALIYYPDLFSEKLFRSQLIYFQNINYEEEVEYLTPNPPSEEDVKAFLIDAATEAF